MACYRSWHVISGTRATPLHALAYTFPLDAKQGLLRMPVFMQQKKTMYSWDEGGVVVAAASYGSSRRRQETYPPTNAPHFGDARKHSCTSPH